MISLPENSVGGERGGNAFQGGDVVALDPFVHRSPRWCANCGGPQTFVTVFEFEGGRVGFCDGCGDEKCVPFSRTMSEVA
jgi:hypothetical protein